MRKTTQKPFEREKLIEELKNEFKRIGSTLLVDYDKKRRDCLPSSHIVRKKLGNVTWTDVLVMCGYEGHYKTWTKEKVLNLLKSKGRQLTFNEMVELDIRPHTVKRYFKSYKNMYEELGWEYKEKEFYTDVTNEELLKEYDNLCKELNRVATAKEIDEYSRYNFEIYRSRFGTLNEVRRLSGYRHRVDPRTITKEDCMREMLLIYDKHGRVPYDRLHEIIPFHYRTLLRKFGTTSVKDVWREVIEEYEKRKSKKSVQ